MTTTLSVGKLVETLNDLFGKFDEAADVSFKSTGYKQKNGPPTSKNYRLLDHFYSIFIILTFTVYFHQAQKNLLLTCSVKNFKNCLENWSKMG